MKPNSRYLERVRLSLGLDKCETSVTGLTEEPDASPQTTLEIKSLAQYIVAQTNGAVRRLKRAVRYAVGMRDHGTRVENGALISHVFKIDM